MVFHLSKGYTRTMITGAFLELLYGIIELVISPIRLLPDVTANSNITAGVISTGKYLAGANVYFPVDTILEILGFVIAFEIAFLAYKIIMWVLRKIPGIA